MGGTKRKLPMEKIHNKQYRAVSCNKRRNGLYSKATNLCLLSNATQIAILATHPLTTSDVSFYSFGHSSVDAVVSAFLSDQRSVSEDDSGRAFWWEDESLAISENVEDLREAMDSVSMMLKNLRETHQENQVKKKKLIKKTHQEN